MSRAADANVVEPNRSGAGAVIENDRASHRIVSAGKSHVEQPAGGSRVAEDGETPACAGQCAAEQRSGVRWSGSSREHGVGSDNEIINQCRAAGSLDL